MINQSDFNFIEFAPIIADIRDSFISEITAMGMFDGLRLNGRLYRKVLRIIEEILKSYTKVVVGKTNVIVIDVQRLSVTNGGLFDPKAFLDFVLQVIDACKRKIPILIKKYNGDMEFHEFLKTGDGLQYLIELTGDKERLRTDIVSFKAFKVFATQNHLKYVLNILAVDPAFKKLFIS